MYAYGTTCMHVRCYTCSAHVRNLLYDIVIMCMMVCVSRVRVAVPVLTFLWGRCGDHPY